MKKKPTRPVWDDAMDAGKQIGGAIESVGRAIHTPLTQLFFKPTPGVWPGFQAEQVEPATPSAARPVEVYCVDYGPDDMNVASADNIDRTLEERHSWAKVRWMNVAGLTDMHVVDSLAKAYGLHALAVEDLLHVPQRPKVERYPRGDGKNDWLFIVLQTNRLDDGTIRGEQLSMFIGNGVVLTFQEHAKDLWEPIQKRIEQSNSRLRQRDVGYLAYALLDEIVDHNFPILEHYGNRLERLETLVLERSSPDAISQIHSIKLELQLRRQIWPLRGVLHQLQREDYDCFADDMRICLADVYDHLARVLEIVETYREVATGLADTYMTVVSNRVNDVMKTLTMVATIFIPISFLAGVFGMNFEDVPCIQTKGAFLVFCIACGSFGIAMLVWFRRKSWL